MGFLDGLRELFGGSTYSCYLCTHAHIGGDGIPFCDHAFSMPQSKEVLINSTACGGEGYGFEAFPEGGVNPEIDSWIPVKENEAVEYSCAHCVHYERDTDGIIRCNENPYNNFLSQDNYYNANSLKGSSRPCGGGSFYLDPATCDGKYAKNV